MDNSIKASNPQKKTPISKFFLSLFLVIVFIIIWCVISDKRAEKDVIEHLNSGDWGVGSKQEYVRDGKKCMGYRIYVKLDYASTEIYRLIISLCEMTNRFKAA